MNIGKRTLAGLVASITLAQSAQGYMFGFKSRDNTPENIAYIEQAYNIDLPIASFIFDPRDEHTAATMERAVKLLGKDRIYHVTVSPGMMTAKQVAAGEADEDFKNFFALVKKHDINVVFRTMHEMNGGRYPRASDPVAFQEARRHVWELSRQAGLTQKNILFNMSVNGWDIPTRDPIPHQRSTLFYCRQVDKKRLRCPTFEDYYPGPDYVDVMGMSFYNRGKGNGNYTWLYPYQIINNSQRRTLDRLKAFEKPLFIDEVGTTSVWYEGGYTLKKSQEVYATNSDFKNDWLLSLEEFLHNEPMIVGGVYFNIDLTNGMSRRVHGEQDRSVIDPISEKVYDGIFNVLDGASDNRSLTSPLYALFGKEFMLLFGKKVLIESSLRPQIIDVIRKSQVTATTPLTKARLAIEAQKGNVGMMTGKKYEKINYLRAIEYAKKFFAEDQTSKTPQK